MTRTSRARIASPERYWLAEGIIWDDRAGEAVWVDIHNGDLVRNLEAPVKTHLDGTVGAVALAEDGGLLVAGHRGLIAISPDGVVSHGPDLIGEGHRLNDGSVDPQGRFLVGTVSLGEQTNEEELLRVSPNGEVEVLRTGLSLSNGIGFASDGTIYHADTWVRRVSAYRDGTWVTVLDDFDGYPDGLTIDADDNLWVAEYGAARVRQFSPTGEVLTTVELDTVEATCVGFLPSGLAITTGRETATDANAGAIYLAEVDASGVPENRWAGSTSLPYWT
jgi:sugar lactone lactonase YvrE